MQRLQEVSHHGGVTAAVSAGWRVNVQCCMIPGRKIADLQRRRFHVAPNLSAAAHHIDDPLTMLCKGAHRHADADAIFIQQVHDLIVYNIVITLIDAPAIRAALQRVQNRFTGRIQAHHRDKSIGNGLWMLQIEARRVIRAAIPVHTPIQTVFRRTVRLVRGVEMRKGAKAADRLTRAAGKPCQDVRVVAALCQDHRTAILTAAPVPAHKAVRHMPVADALNMLNRDKLPDRAAVDQLLELHKERRIAQHMADGKHVPGLPGFFAHCDQLRAVIAHRLFAEHIVALFQCLCDRCKVHPILRADKDAVGKLILCQRSFPACKAFVGCDVMRFRKRCTPILPRLCYADDFQFIREIQRVAAVDIRAALTRAQNDRGNWFHRQASLYSISSTVSAGFGSR